jgi:hypothetical protein
MGFQALAAPASQYDEIVTVASATATNYPQPNKVSPNP